MAPSPFIGSGRGRIKIVLAELRVPVYRVDVELTLASEAEVRNVTFPRLLDPVDDLPPATVITCVHREPGERGVSTPRLIVRGTTSDNGTVRRVLPPLQAFGLKPAVGEMMVVTTHAQVEVDP